MRDKQSLASYAGKSYFIYTGNAYSHKNLNRLIDAILQLKVKLKIVSGRNIFVDRLKEVVKQKKGAAFVEIIGFTSDEGLKKLYKNSIGFVFPTLAEGFGLPPKEAIEAGTIAIVSDIPVLKEVYEDSVFYFDPTDINSIVNSLNKVIKLNKEEKNKKIQYAQKFLKKYSWEKMARKTLEVYKNII